MKPETIAVGKFTKFVYPIIRPMEPSAVDQLAAIVSERARKRLERKKRWPHLSPAQIANTLPMVSRRRQAR